METNDKLLKDFFGAQKQEIADNGFSKRVSRKLPEVADRSWIVWVFAAIGMAVSIYFALTGGWLEHGFALLFKSVPYYYLLLAISSVPLIGTAGFYLSQNKNYRFG